MTFYESFMFWVASYLATTMMYVVFVLCLIAAVLVGMYLIQLYWQIQLWRMLRTNSQQSVSMRARILKYASDPLFNEYSGIRLRNAVLHREIDRIIPYNSRTEHYRRQLRIAERLYDVNYHRLLTSGEIRGRGD